MAMPVMADAALDRVTPDCRVLLAWSALKPERKAALTHNSVDHAVALLRQCATPFNAPKLALINGSDFAPGVGVGIELGLAGKCEAVFKGEVVALEPLFRRDVAPSLRVICQES